MYSSLQHYSWNLSLCVCVGGGGSPYLKKLLNTKILTNYTGDTLKHKAQLFAAEIYEYEGCLLHIGSVRLCLFLPVLSHIDSNPVEVIRLVR